jgi:uncharacterized protein with PIN domain
LPDERLYVFDSCAVIALLQREPGAEVVAEILKDPQSRCLIHAVNACEVYYDIYRRGGAEDASALEEILATSGIELIEVIPSLSGGPLENSRPNGGGYRWQIVSLSPWRSWRTALS